MKTNKKSIFDYPEAEQFRYDTHISLVIANPNKYMGEDMLLGKWFSLPIDDIGEALKSINIDVEKDEPYAIIDYASDLDYFEAGEDVDLYELNDNAKLIETWDSDKLGALNTYLECVDSNFNNAVDAIGSGSYTFFPGKTTADIAWEFVHDGTLGEISDSLIEYIDYDAVERDLRYDGYTEGAYGVIIDERKKYDYDD